VKFKTPPLWFQLVYLCRHQRRTLSVPSDSMEPYKCFTIIAMITLINHSVGWTVSSCNHMVQHRKIHSQPSSWTSQARLTVYENHKKYCPLKFKTWTHTDRAGRLYHTLCTCNSICSTETKHSTHHTYSRDECKKDAHTQIKHECLNSIDPQPQCCKVVTCVHTHTRAYRQMYVQNCSSLYDPRNRKHICPSA